MCFWCQPLEVICSMGLTMWLMKKRDYADTLITCITLWNHEPLFVNWTVFQLHQSGHYLHWLSVLNWKEQFLDVDSTLGYTRLIELNTQAKFPKNLVYLYKTQSNYKSQLNLDFATWCLIAEFAFQYAHQMFGWFPFRGKPNLSTHYRFGLLLNLRIHLYREDISGMV